MFYNIHLKNKIFIYLRSYARDLLRLLTKKKLSEYNNIRVIVVTHDANRQGAQFLALGIVRSLKNDLSLDVETVILGPGSLRKEFKKLCPAHRVYSGKNFEVDARSLAHFLFRRGFRYALVNSTVSGRFAEIMSEAGVNCVCLVHELPILIRNNGLLPHTQAIANSAQFVVFPAEIVANGFSSFSTVPPEKVKIRPQGLYRHNPWRYERNRARTELRKRLNIAPDTQIVLAVGYADRRKGGDLFVKMAVEVLHRRPDVVFIWVGHWEDAIKAEMDIVVASSKSNDSFHFPGFQPDTALYHAGADLFALTSREDPLPNVVLESFDVGVPVVAFAGSGGGADLLAKVGGIVVPQDNVGAYASAVLELLEQPGKLNDLGRAAQSYADANLAFRSYLFDLCRFLGLSLPRVSVIVPNYNYAKYIVSRLSSIRDQSVPFYELIILDDASSDGSLKIIQDWLITTNTEARIVTNTSNSGSVFEQWRRGIALATGDFIWIAEADDLSSPNFLETVLPPLMAGQVVMSYCESSQIDESGKTIADNYIDYVQDISPSKWKDPYISEGLDEITNYLAIKNTIPNVSAVVFRRDILEQVFELHFSEISKFKRAGDWMVYIYALTYGSIAFSPYSANRHRRHGGSVIHSSAARQLYDEIQRVQGFVENDFFVEESIKIKSQSYLDCLIKQFGLADSTEKS